MKKILIAGALFLLLTLIVNSVRTVALTPSGFYVDVKGWAYQTWAHVECPLIQIDSNE